jgi:hypothetical protein
MLRTSEYVAAGLLSFSGLVKQEPKQITKQDVQDLITAFNDLNAIGSGMQDAGASSQGGNDPKTSRPDPAK